MLRCDGKGDGDGRTHRAIDDVDALGSAVLGDLQSGNARGRNIFRLATLESQGQRGLFAERDVVAVQRRGKARRTGRSRAETERAQTQKNGQAK